MRRSFLLALLVFVIPLAAAQTLNVKIIDRKESTSSYTYVLPGRSELRATSSANCVGGESSVNCSGETQAKGSQTPAQSVTYQVNGATFALQLPDGRIAVVNCEVKRNTGRSLAGGLVGGMAEAAGSSSSNSHPVLRNCRTPLLNEIQVEFKGDKAKLKWPVSIDGKKMDSETYKILGVLPGK